MDESERMSTTPPPHQPDTSHHSVPEVTSGTPLPQPPPLVSLGHAGMGLGGMGPTPYTLAVSMSGLSPGVVTSMTHPVTGGGFRTSPGLPQPPYWPGPQRTSPGGIIRGPEVSHGGLMPPSPSSTQAQAADSSRGGTTPQRGLRTPTVIMGEAGGVKTMFWTAPEPMGAPGGFGGPREVLGGPYDNGESLRASVDGLLSLGQERRNSPPQLSPSSTMSLSPAARSPLHHPTNRSPHGPYPIAPPSPSFGGMVRGMVSSQSSPVPLHASPSPYVSSPVPLHSSPQPLNMERLWAGDRSQVNSDH